MTKNKGKGKWIILLALVVSTILTGCGNDDSVTPTAEVITGDITADGIIEDTHDAVEDTVSALCKACLVGELLGGDKCNCNNICDAEVECKVQEEGE